MQRDASLSNRTQLSRRVSASRLVREPAGPTVAIYQYIWLSFEATLLGHIMRSTRVRVTLSSLFQAVQGGLGVSVTPSHFYFPVPKLKSFQSKDWTACRPCTAPNL